MIASTRSSSPILLSSPGPDIIHNQQGLYGHFGHPPISPNTWKYIEETSARAKDQYEKDDAEAKRHARQVLGLEDDGEHDQPRVRTFS